MKKWMYLILLFTMAFLGGCSQRKIIKIDQLNSYNVYYVDSKTSGIVSEAYEPSGATKEELAQELFTMLKTEPQNRVYRKAVPETVTVKEIDFSSEDTLTLDFDATYSELSGIAEVICRATIVKTLSQIDGLEYIKFIVNGQPLIDSNGVQIGLMTDDDFIESTGTEMNYQVILYFASEDGKSLMPLETDIYYTGSSSIEEIVINQLINGTTESGMQNAIPTGTKLLNVTTKEGICYVDFNEKFLEAMQGITDAATIYSVVNSLVELPNINKVQFLINSAVRENFRESIVFSGFFERNLEIITEGNR